MAFLAWISYEIYSNYSYVYVAENGDSKPPVQSKEIVGIAKVIDGDSIMVSDLYEVRLLDVDAPEYNQKCLDGNNNEYFCGRVSKNFLKNMIEDKQVKCSYYKKDVYHRFLGCCYVEERNINSEIVKNGMAVLYSFDEAPNDLKNVEMQDMRDRIGIWQGSFLEPKVYRQKFKY